MFAICCLSYENVYTSIDNKISPLSFSKLENKRNSSFMVITYPPFFSKWEKKRLSLYKQCLLLSIFSFQLQKYMYMYKKCRSIAFLMMNPTKKYMLPYMHHNIIPLFLIWQEFLNKALTYKGQISNLCFTWHHKFSTSITEVMIQISQYI